MTTGIEHGKMGELVRYFLRLGFLGFGGPVALVGRMERELVNADGSDPLEGQQSSADRSHRRRRAGRPSDSSAGVVAHWALWG
ncbi:hypothetical protein [Bradyrhizobium guangxiense]|uniref:hypothetical protein n=1 Tax=Bradyrhizobium guangxiense TaxID=1325115 RepID=UPI001ABFCE9E|nr:hypothetical protein [Bradyrhizobium guangxiense]